MNQFKIFTFIQFIYGKSQKNINNNRTQQKEIVQNRLTINIV